MKKVLPKKGEEFFVDDEDFERVKVYKWHVQVSAGGHNYAKSTEVGLMHRFITNANANKVVDHKNDNGFDNRKENLRVCSHSQNMVNRKLQKNNTFGYRGVYWSKQSKKWNAQVQF